jgi:hypothetical protein
MLEADDVKPAVTARAAPMSAGGGGVFGEEPAAGLERPMYGGEVLRSVLALESGVAYAAHGLLVASSRSAGSSPPVASPALPESPITMVWKGFCAV